MCVGFLSTLKYLLLSLQVVLVDHVVRIHCAAPVDPVMEAFSPEITTIGIRAYILFSNKRLQVLRPRNKKIVLSQHVTFDETSLLKSAIPQQVERLKTKDVSWRVEVDATPPPPVDSVSVRTSPNVTSDGDHVASFDAEHV